MCIYKILVYVYMFIYCFCSSNLLFYNLCFVRGGGCGLGVGGGSGMCQPTGSERAGEVKVGSLVGHNTP